MAQAFVAQQLAETAAGKTIAAVRNVAGGVRSYADQAVRASGSVALNLSEGYGRRNRDKQHHYTIAYASAREASSALRILAAANAIGEEQSVEIEVLLDRVRAMTWRLIHSR